MSEIIDSGEGLLDDAVESATDTANEVGMTSEEASADTSADSTEKKGLLGSMTVYDAMLLIALICVTLATLKLFFELREFGNFPAESPWRTNEISR